MQTPGMIGFSAFSGTGKTTLVEKVVRILKAKGLSVAVIKHDGHDFEIDHEGTDSWRYQQAGADVTILSSAKKTAYIEHRAHALWDNVAMVKGADLILVEGYKYEKIPRIGMTRKANGKGLPEVPETYLAIVTDDEQLEACGVPIFHLDDAEGVAAFAAEHAVLVDEIRR